MSRAYRIQVAEGVQRVVHVEDGVQGAIEVLPILAPARMAELLAAELEKRGYARTVVDGAVVLVKVRDDNVTVEVNVSTGVVAVSFAEDVTVQSQVAATGVGTSIEQAREQATELAKSQIDVATGPLREHARRQATAKLEAELLDVRPELDAAVNAATAAALIEKARQLGEIESIEGSAEEGNLTIKVRV